MLGLTWFPSYSVWDTCQSVEPALGVSSSKGIRTQSPSRGPSLLFILIAVLGSWNLSRLACLFPKRWYSERMKTTPGSGELVHGIEHILCMWEPHVLFLVPRDFLGTN